MKPAIRPEGASLDRLPQGSPEQLRDFFTDSVGCMRDLHRTHGLIVSFAKGSQQSIFAFGPECNRLLLQDPEVFQSLGFYVGPKNSAQRRLGSGLFNLNGDRHKQHRRLIMPLFQKGVLDSYRGFLTELVDELLAGWQPGRQYDLVAEMKTLALRMTTRMLFGVRDVELAATIDALFEQWLELNHRVAFQALLPVEPCHESYDRMLLCARDMEVLIGTLVRQRRDAVLAEDVLSVLLHARDAGVIHDQDVVGEAAHMFNAAYHTTTYAMTWTLFLLAQHPEVMAMLYDELTGACSSGRLLERCVRESLRVLPPVVYYARMNVQACMFGPHGLPRGTLCVGSHFVTHHLADLYPQPEAFLPDRWLTADPGPYGYVPFGGGARMCLGAGFAQVVFDTCLRQILRRFRLAVVPGARIDRKCTLTLGPRLGIPVTMHRADRRYSAAPVVGDIHELVTLPSARPLTVAA